MSKKLTVTLALSLGALFACQSDVTSPAQTLSGPRFAAQSGGVETNISVPFSFTAFVPCANGGAGEDVAVSGNLHILFNVTIDNRGGLHVKEHFQPQGASGVGLTTGDTYRAVGVTQSEFNVKAGFETTQINNFRLIGPGPNNNLQVHEVLHVTVNANGVVTVVHVSSSIECN